MLLPDLDLLSPARMHEAVGPGRRAFAFGLAARLTGAIIWIQDMRNQDALYPPGIAQMFDPQRLILVRPSGVVSVLQAMEEALRSGAAPLVVGELDQAPDLTASRRLQLAAGTGGGRGLCLVPEGRLRTNAAETRWMCMPMPGAGKACQSWEILKNKRGRLGQWQVHWAGQGFIEQARQPLPA